MRDDLGFPGPTGAAGPDTPLEMLAACHQDLLAQCAALEHLVLYIGECGVDGQARQLACSVMRFFDEAVPQHHADEEQDLFPALLESMAGSDPVCLREMTWGLAQEHRAQEAAWRRLRPALERTLDGDEAVLAAGDVDAFVCAYTSHIEREDGELLPMAARLLGDGELMRLGMAMGARRGLLA
ncbi:MAG: hemerythrin domain-containing protein [Pseudomonadota bacterium]